MRGSVSSGVLRKKWILIVVGLPILAATWWAFRPEKLWINQRVDEPAPFASRSEPQPLYTGRLEGKAHPTSGRATIYEDSDGSRYLRLSDFMTSNGPDLHVVLTRADYDNLSREIVDGDLDRVEVGRLKGNQGDQNYNLPASVDLEKYNAAVILCERFHAIFGLARMEPF
jgi:hypothetical protein